MILICRSWFVTDSPSRKKKTPWAGLVVGRHHSPSKTQTPALACCDDLSLPNWRNIICGGTICRKQFAILGNCYINNYWYWRWCSFGSRGCRGWTGDCPPENYKSAALENRNVELSRFENALSGRHIISQNANTSYSINSLIYKVSNVQGNAKGFFEKTKG